MVDCLEYVVEKENEIPKIIDLIFKNLGNNNHNFIQQINKKMRSEQEILKDYGLS